MKKLLFFASAVAMLASCSKDFTEEVGFSAPEGKVKIVARVSMEEETTTRTHIDEKNNYVWDQGDAIGVFVATNGDASNAYFGYTGKGNDFTGDFLPALPKGATGYYGYYPWDRSATLKNNIFDPNGQKLTMYINAKQKYNRNKSSFAATEAPAVAYTATLSEDVDSELSFIGLAAYIKIKVYGIGEIRSLKLKMNGEKVKDAALNGEFDVDMSTLPAIFEANEGKEVKEYVYPTYAIVNEGLGAASEAQKEITLDLGSKTVNLNLDPTKNEDFWFVVPAGLEFAEGDSIDFFVNDDEEASFTYTFKAPYTTKSNTIARLSEKSATEDNPFEYVADNATLISEPEDLLWYLYFVNHGEYAFAAYGDDHETFFNITKAEGPFATTTYTLKPAILTKDIDLTGVLERLYEDQYQQLSEADKALYDWFVHPVKGGADAEYYINSIGGLSDIDEKEPAYAQPGNPIYQPKAAEGWKIKGYGEGVTISGLTIKGNGVFATEGASNITLKNVTVDASEVEDETIHFLYKTLLDGVTIGADCQLVGAEGALIDKVQAPNAVKIPEGLVFPTDEEGEEIAFAYTLDINGDIVWADYKDYNFVEKKISKDGAVVTVADKAGAEEFFATEIDTEGVTYYSVVDAAGTSYWTGTQVSAFSGTEIKYAEELAYVKSTGSTRNKNYTLANNIDLMSKSWAITRATGTFTLDGKGNTISNVKIDKLGLDGAAFTMFGPNANISNLTIDGVEIVVPADAKIRTTDKYLAVATLAGEGSASKVTVTGLKIDASASTVTPTYVGGLFAVYKGGDVTDCSVALAADAPAGYGDLAGLYTITADKEENPINFKATVNGANKLVGKVLVDVTYAGSTYTTLTFTGYAEAVLPVWADVEYNHTVSDASGAIIDKFTLMLGEKELVKEYYDPKEKK